MGNSKEDIKRSASDCEPFALNSNLDNPSISKSRRLLFFLVIGCFIFLFFIMVLLRFEASFPAKGLSIPQSARENNPPVSDWLPAYPNSAHRTNCRSTATNWTDCTHTSADSAEKIASFYDVFFRENGFEIHKYQQNSPNGCNIHILAKDGKAGKRAFLQINENILGAVTEISMRFK